MNIKSRIPELWGNQTNRLQLKVKLEILKPISTISHKQQLPTNNSIQQIYLKKSSNAGMISIKLIVLAFSSSFRNVQIRESQELKKKHVQNRKIELKS